ncbi:hypothetical protein DSECCO2_289830 [anaerobic digester metagenome]
MQETFLPHCQASVPPGFVSLMANPFTAESVQAMIAATRFVSPSRIASMTPQFPSKRVFAIVSCSGV